MSSLIERIREDAGRRLALPEGRSPSEELGRYRDYLKFEGNRLRLLHKGGASGREVCEARAEVLDLLVRHVVEGVLGKLPVPAGERPRLAVVAVGGYGRGLLNPFSDIDILFLHNADGTVLARGKVHPWVESLVHGVFYTLTDISLKLGQAVRTVDDCVAVANKDMQSKTALLEARLITGDPELFKRMESVFLTKCVRGYEDEYLEQRLADQEARRTKFGGSATMQEPNVKSGCGGLRDYQNLLWMAFFKYRTRTLADLEQRELISAEEHRCLERAHDFLLRVRNEMHYEQGRAAEVLLRAIQPRIAHGLGYTDRSPARRLEAFMRDLYTHMRNLYLITRTLERRLALLPDPQQRMPSFRQLLRRGRRRMGRQLVDGFQVVEGEIGVMTGKVFREDPRRLLRVFAHSQKRGLRLHPDLAQLIRQNLGLVDDAFRADLHVRGTFLEILGQRGNVAGALRAMHDTGLLGCYLPEFEPLTCLVQHEFYHQYTTDEHTLKCLEHLDRVWEAKAAPHSNYAEIYRSLERPQVLHLALLLHDAGKARRDADHSRAGGELALVAAERLGLDGATAHTLKLVIELHLLMAQISQRRDLDDPAVIGQFARQVQTLENLQILTLHTLVDSLGTNEKLWNGFKDSLLQRLYRKTQDWMQGQRMVVEETQRELLAAEVREKVAVGGKAGGLPEDEFEAHFRTLPDRYYHYSTAGEVVGDLELVHRFLERQFAVGEEPLAPVVRWQDDVDRGCTVVRVCTWDRTGLFSHLTGALAAAGLNILAARIFTRSDSIILDTFAVTDARSGGLARKDERERFERLLTKVLTGSEVNFGEMIARRAAVAPLYQSLEGERIPLAMRFDNETSSTCTVLDLEVEDHVGLLHAITRTLAGLGLDIALARVLTEKGAAVDSFYLAEAEGGKILSAQRLGEIEEQLRVGIGQLTRAV